MIWRGFERLLALMLLITCLPVLIAAAACVLVFSGSPVLHRDLRCGEGEQLIHLLKLRTLKPGTGAARDSSSIAVEGDPRITAPGRYLRQSRVDELVQFWQVLTGQLRLVGPRPLKPEHLAALPKELAINLTRHKPGMLSASSVNFTGDDAALADWQQSRGSGMEDVERHYVATLLPEKVRQDLAFESRATWLDRISLMVDAATLPLRPRARQLRRQQTARLLGNA